MEGQLNSNENMLRIEMSLYYLKGSFLNILMTLASSIIIFSVGFFILQKKASRS